ncbi:MAG: pyridoxamine 5'-phosphate oxidase family protein [Lachnospiraceae bacterium]|nr:pyridoxamine 5'-phosphate oxidase family protein [Lachnospiraceae bacterium]
MSKVNDFLTEAGTFFLATVDKDQPKVRPLGLHMEMDEKILFGVGSFKDVFKQLISNPKVEICACRPDGHWLRYTGTAVFETDPKYAEAALEAMPHLRSIYNEETGYKMMVFHLEDATAVEIPVMGEGTDLLN